jgi:hypothetical protein
VEHLYRSALNITHGCKHLPVTKITVSHQQYKLQLLKLYSVSLGIEIEKRKMKKKVLG